MKIKNAKIKEIFDSRGEPTLEVLLSNSDGRTFNAQVPSGKSRGSNEAKVINFKTAEKVLKNKIQKGIVNRSFTSIRAFDKKILAFDSTKNKSAIGGNLSLGLSIAFTRALSDERKEPVWRTIRKEFFGAGKSTRFRPRIFSNLINGGAHANNNLNIQEYLVVLKTGPNLEKDIEILIRLYRKLGSFLGLKYKQKNLPIGDEGGYSLDFKDNFEPISILEKLIFENHLEDKFGLALDAAATNFKKGKYYEFDGIKISSSTLLSKYRHYFKNSKLLFSIEDPFAEKDSKDFRGLLSQLPNKLVVGDDLTTTNPSLIEKYSREKAINAVIIKPNQIGTVSETCQSLKISKKKNLKCIVSHRSGETDDNFIIQLAASANTFGVKIGAPIKERIFKFDELINLSG